MDEDELGWIGKLQPFGAAEAAQWEARLGRCDSLGKALWGEPLIIYGVNYMSRTRTYHAALIWRIFRYC